MEHDHTVGEGCRAWVLDAIYRACSVHGGQRPARLAEAAWRFATVGPALEAYGQWQQQHQRLAASSTAPAELRRMLQQLAAMPPPGALEVRVEAPPPVDELEPLRGCRLRVELLSIRSSPVYVDHAVLLLHDGVRGYTLHVWNPWRLDGVWILEGAEVSGDATTVRFASPDGTLELRGTPILEQGADARPSAPRVDAPDPEQTRGWPEARALLDKINARSRWDYAIQADRRRGRLALTGRSGAYEEGCHLILRDVHAARVPRHLSHPVFRWLRRTQIPEELRPPTTGWLALGIEADAGSSDASQLVVVARGVLFADSDGPAATFRVGHASAPRARPSSVPEPLVAVGARSDPRVRRALQALPGLGGPGPSAVGRALWALRDLFPDGDAGLALPMDVVVAGMWAALDTRRPLGPLADELVVDPLAAGPVRDAQRRRARQLLHTAAAAPCSAQTRAALRADLQRIRAPAPSERILVDARAALVHEVVRREQGLPPQGVALDLERVTVGRVLSDPEAEARLSLPERRARSAWLEALSDDGRPELEGPALQLARVGHLDVNEVTWWLEGEAEVADLYRLLRALLHGDRALPPRGAS